jgi:hypothetical protein
MFRKWCVFALPALFVGALVSRADEHPSACWCIPAIQREATAQAEARRMSLSDVSGVCFIWGNEKNPEPTAAAPPATDEDPPDFFGQTLEATADRLYYQAVNLDNAGERERAAEKFVTLLEQCPDCAHRHDVVRRLNAIAEQWLETAEQQRPGSPKNASGSTIPEGSFAARGVIASEAEERAKHLLETVQHLLRRKVIDPDVFIWDHEPHEYLEGWDWVEDILTEDPADAFRNGLPISGLACGPIMDATDRTPSRRWFSSPWRQRIMMQVQCVEERPVSPGIWRR